MAEEKYKDNKNNSFKYIIIFIIFLAVGIVIGFYFATNYLEKQDNDEQESSTPEIKEITNDSVYQEVIKNLYNTVKNNTYFYNSKGVKFSSLDNITKLSLIYDYIVLNNMFTKETLSKNEFGTCDNGFILDPSGSANIPSLVCTVYKIKTSDIVDTGKKLYNDSTISVSADFSPEVGRNCVLTNDMYTCGNTSTPVSGALEIKFDIQKVTLAPDGTIEIYDKGYLADRRAGVDNPNDQYDNYYLHTSDSTTYYYELKSADNVTFKHTFKTTDNTNYYYVSTEVFNG